MLLLLLLSCTDDLELKPDPCTEFKVDGRLSAAGFLLVGETVRAQSPTGSTFTAETDSFGAFKLTLPLGDWTLSVVDSCYEGSFTVTGTECIDTSATIEAAYQCVG